MQFILTFLVPSVNQDNIKKEISFYMRLSQQSRQEPSGMEIDFLGRNESDPQSWKRQKVWSENSTHKGFKPGRREEFLVWTGNDSRASGFWSQSNELTLTGFSKVFLSASCLTDELMTVAWMSVRDPGCERHQEHALATDHGEPWLLRRHGGNLITKALLLEHQKAVCLKSW